MIAWLLAASSLASMPPGSIRSCDHIGALRSVDAVVPPGSAAPRPVQHVFQNGGRLPLRLWWIDRQAARVDLGTIEPSRFKSIETFAGHAFVLTDPRNRCRAALRVDGVLTGTYVGTSRYRAVPVDGWPVFVDRALDPATGPARAALATLARQLGEARTVLPPAALARIATTPIFVHEHAGPAGMFHTSPDWLVANGRTVELTNAIEIPDAAMFVEIAKTQPAVLLHELTHAFHRTLTPEESAAIAETYRLAVGSGRYRAVKHHDGSVGAAYAAQNPAEYFAELSEAHFGRNDFFPFTRAELAAYDPAGERLMVRLWR